MLQLDNQTPFAANIALFPNEQGVDSLYVITKASFNIGKKWTLCDEQLPPQQADEYYQEPLFSSLKLASDYHIGKTATDIIMLGSACAPEGSTADILDVSLSLANKQKVVRVFGDRVWGGGRLSQPRHFDKMPLIYEKAYGGAEYENEQLVRAEERNPVGRGYLGKRSISAFDGELAPNLEDPRELIQSPKDQPTPACFGFVAPNWRPRVEYAGTYDQHWQQTRAPFLPGDFNRRFLNTASSDLICDDFVRGGEAVKISHMHPAGELNFYLPVVKLKCQIHLDGQIIDLPSNAETVVLEPNELRLSMVFRSELICDKKISKIKEVSLRLMRS